MNSTNKKSTGARGISQPFKQQTERAPQFKPGVAQPKSAVSAQSAKRPVAPPVYRPQAKPVGVQAKMAGSSQMKSHPVAPPAYRPQPVPKVLQTKLASHQQSNPAPSSRRPAAPPVYRPEAKKIVQPKMASAIRADALPKAHPVYGSQPKRANVAAIRTARQDTIQNGRAAPLAPRVVQRKLIFNAGTEYLDPTMNVIPIEGYTQTLTEAEEMSPVIAVRAEKPKVGVAAYSPDDMELKGEIKIEPLDPVELGKKDKAYTERLIAMAHETRHGIDDLTKKVRYRKDKEERIHTEWRAFATQSAVAFALIAQGQPVRDRYPQEMASYADKGAFTHSKSKMTEITKSYMILYGLNQNPTDQDVAAFMQNHDDWVDEALALYQNLLPKQVSQQVAQNLQPPGTDSTWWTTGLKYVGGAVAVAGIAYLLKSYYGLGK